MYVHIKNELIKNERIKNELIKKNWSPLTGLEWKTFQYLCLMIGGYQENQRPQKMWLKFWKDLFTIGSNIALKSFHPMKYVPVLIIWYLIVHTGTYTVNFHFHKMYISWSFARASFLIIYSTYTMTWE